MRFYRADRILIGDVERFSLRPARRLPRVHPALSGAEAMAEPTPALAVTRVPGLRWRVYAVSEGTVVVGYLSRLPDGRWLVYDAQGIVRVGFLRPRDALAALWATVRSR